MSDDQKTSFERAGDILKLQPRKIDIEKTAVIMNIPHITHLYSAVLGSKDITSKPMKGMIQHAIITHMRWFCTLRV
jgi:hypothetical protein